MTNVHRLVKYKLTQQQINSLEQGCVHALQFYDPSPERECYDLQ